MKIFVVLATREREDLLARTLASLAQCRRPEGFRGTLVVENGLRGGTERVVRKAAATLEARYLFVSASNKSRALNAAMAQIDEGLVVFLDDDVRVLPDLLEVYAAAARRAGPGQFFGGPVAPDYEEAPPDWLIEFLPLSARGWRPDDPSQATTRPFFLGFNWAAFAGDLRRIGGFSERFGPGTDAGVGDEADIQRRLVTAGLKAMCVPQALVYHWVPRDRCSPEWALERAYRNGIRSGLLKQEAAAGPTIAGYPLVLIKRIVESWVRSQMPRNGQRSERFAAELKYQRQRGVLRGVLLRSGNRATGQRDGPRSGGDGGSAGPEGSGTAATVSQDL
jgi:GT2 family glycosyltransferase